MSDNLNYHGVKREYIMKYNFLDHLAESVTPVIDNKLSKSYVTIKFCDTRHGHLKWAVYGLYSFIGITLITVIGILLDHVLK